MLHKLPNILSVIRILLSVILLFITNSFSLFLVIYLAAGLCNAITAQISLRLAHEEMTQTSMKSIGNLTFYLVCLYKLFFQIPVKIPHVIQMLIIGVFLLKVIAFLLTRWKFHIWSSLQTIGNKISGLLVFIFIPVCLYTHKMSFIPAVILIVLIFLVTFEEILLILSSSHYDVNQKSIFTR